jgi:Fur family transcriptional regulator, iron response regulator
MSKDRPYSALVQRLKAAGLRPTRQRLALAKLLFEAPGGCDRHITAEQLHAEAVADSVRVSLATIYNSLHQFTEAGLLREVVVDSGRSYFDTNVTDHHHFYFEDSGRLQDIPGEMVQLESLPTPPVGAKVARVDVIIRLQDSE